MPLKNDWQNGDLFTPAAANDMANAVNNFNSLVFDAREYGVIADGSPHNNVANLLDCVAACATAGGGTVLLPAGTIVTSGTNLGTVTADSGNTYTNNGGIPLPQDTPITIAGHGTGVTVLRLSTGFIRAFDFWETGGSYSDVTLRDFTVDRNNILGVNIAPATAVTSGVTLTGGGVWTTLPGISATTFRNAQSVYFLPSGGGTAAGQRYVCRVSGSNFQVLNNASNVTVNSGDTVQASILAHVIVGNYCNTYLAGINQVIDKVLVENVSAINVAESAGPSLTGNAANRTICIQVNVSPSGSPATVPQVTNLTARNVRMEGGAYGIEVAGSNPNTFLDNIYFADCYHDTGVTPVNNWNSSNFIIGGNAWVNRVGVVRCIGKNSGDVAFEVNQPWTCYEVDCVWEDSWIGVYRTSFGIPARTAAGPPTTTLNNGGTLSSGASSCTVTALPADVQRQGLAKIDSELIWYEVTNAAGTTWNIWRGINNSTAASHANAATITFVETSRTRVYSIRSTIKNKEALTVGSGHCFASFENNNLPIPPITIRDATVTNIGGNFTTNRAGHVFNNQGWCPEIDISGLRVDHSGLNITATSGPGSAIASYTPYTKTMFTAGVPFPAPRLIGRNNIVKVHGKMSTPLVFSAWHQREGLIEYDLDIEADLNISNASTLLGANFGNGAIGKGSRIGVTMRTVGDVGSTVNSALSVGSSSFVSIEKSLTVDVDVSQMKFLTDSTDSNYYPWSVDPNQLGKVIIGKVAHSSSVTGNYPSSKSPTVKTSTNYTVGSDDQIVLVDSTAGAVTVTLPKSTGASSTGEPLNRGRQLTIIDVGFAAGSNAITIAPAAADKIDNGTAGTSITIGTAGGQLVLTADPAMPGWVSDRSAIKGYLDAATSTLSNKSISLGSNTVTGTLAQFNTAVTDANLARTDAANTFTGVQTMTSPAITTPTGIVKGDVGLGNVDNTSDANKPVSTATQTALNGKVPVDYISGTVQTMPRNYLRGNEVTTVSGTMYWNYFTADQTVTITKLTAVTGTVAAAATPTLLRMGIYSVDSSDNVTLIASTPNDTALFSATSTLYAKTLTASVSLTAGSRYALGFIGVSSAAMPRLIGITSLNGTLVSTTPFLAGYRPSLTDLPSSYPSGSMYGGQTFAFYMSGSA